MSLISSVQPIRPEAKFAARAKSEPAAGKKPSAPATPAQTLPSVPADLQLVYFAASRRLKQAEAIARAALTVEQFEQENEVLTWDQYLNKVFDQPKVARDAYQRLYDMIAAQGRKEAFADDGSPMRTASGDRIYSYNFFTNPANGSNTISGMEQPLHQIVQALKAAAQGGDTRNRYFRLDGPVGTAKSTIVTILKRGLENYSRSEEGALYALQWNNIPEEVATGKELQLDKHPKTGKYFYVEPMNDDPLRVIPEESGARADFLKELNAEFAQQNGGKAPYKIQIKGGLSPASNLIRQQLLEYYSDQIKQGKIKLGKDQTLMDLVLRHVEARRLVLDETKRVGIGNYMPKDAKNQDSTELNGDIDYSKLPMYGNPNHPLVQAYRGEFNIANRGIMDFEEMLKLQREFLYDILTASQERMVKPKNGTLLPIDMLIVGKTNMEELDEKLQDDKMKAFFNRAKSFRVPYLLEAKKEAKIYEKGFLRLAAEQGKTVAPHTLDVAARWAVLTRVDPQITQSESIRNGQGMYGVSPRFLQNVFDDVLVHSQSEESASISPFTVVRVIREQLNKDDFQDRRNWDRYHALLQLAVKSLTETVRRDVMTTFLNDTDLMRSYFHKYVKNLERWQKDPESADENFMRRVEVKMKAPVANAAVREYRDNLLVKLNTLDNTPVSLDLLEEDPNLKQALADIMFEDMKNQLEDAPMERVVDNLKKLETDEGFRYTDATAKEAIEHLTTPGGIV